MLNPNDPLCDKQHYPDGLRPKGYILARLNPGAKKLATSINVKLDGYMLITKVSKIDTIEPSSRIILLHEISQIDFGLTEKKWREWMNKLSKFTLVMYNMDVLAYTILKTYAVHMRHLFVPGTCVFTNDNRGENNLNWMSLFDELYQVRKRTLVLKSSLSNSGRGQLKTRSWKASHSYITNSINNCPSGVVICQPLIPNFKEWKLPVVHYEIPTVVRQIYGDEVFRASVIIMRAVLTCAKIKLPVLWRLDIVLSDGQYYLNEIETVSADYVFYGLDFVDIVSDTWASAARMPG